MAIRQETVFVTRCTVNMYKIRKEENNEFAKHEAMEDNYEYKGSAEVKHKYTEIQNDKSLKHDVTSLAKSVQEFVETTGIKDNVGDVVVVKHSNGQRFCGIIIKPSVKSSIRKIYPYVIPIKDFDEDKILGE